MLAKRHPRRKDIQLRVAIIGGRGVGGNYGGVETWTEEVGKRLVEHGHEVTVYCRSHYTPQRLREYAGMGVVRLPTVRSKHLETLVHTALATAHAMLSGYDVVHYQALGPSVFSWLPRITGAKTVVTVQGLDWQRRKWGRLARMCLKLAERTAVYGPSRMTAVSRKLQGHFQENYARAVDYIPNGVTPIVRRAKGRLREWGLEPQGYILYLGRLTEEKRCSLLAEAFAEVDGPVKLVFAGRGHPGEDYEAELRKHESERVRFLGWASGEEREELLANAMLFVLPSEIEGLSLALLEAMGAGVCVLVSDIEENLEAIGNAGFAFRRGDRWDLAHIMRLLIERPDLRARAAQRAKARVERDYLWESVVNEIERVYFGLAFADSPRFESPDEHPAKPRGELIPSKRSGAN